jgi:hypothetical protein
LYDVATLIGLFIKSNKILVFVTVARILAKLKNFGTSGSYDGIMAVQLQPVVANADLLSD